MQYELGPSDLQLVLALVRGGTLALAADRMSVDTSTVFRSVQRIEKGLGQRLFERSRSGYQPSELALLLASHAEQMESHLEAARSAAQTSAPAQLSGTVRITTTDTLLHGLVAPALKSLQTIHPLLDYELHTGNELASLTRRDADLALRATRRPPPHLIGKHIGPIRVAMYAASSQAMAPFVPALAERLHWIAPDDALPEHPSVVWRRKHFPKVVPAYRVNSILTVAELVALGLGVGLLPVFLAQGRNELVQVSPVLEECQTELWLLSHTESRHLRRVSAVFAHLASTLSLQ